MDGINRDGKYKLSDGTIEPYETLEFDEMFVYLTSPFQTFFETLCKCEGWEQRGMGEMGLCLLRDIGEHWHKFTQAIEKNIGEIEIDVDAEGKEKNMIEPFEHPDYIGASLTPAPKK